MECGAAEGGQNGHCFLSRVQLCKYTLIRDVFMIHNRTQLLATKLFEKSVCYETSHLASIDFSKGDYCLYALRTVPVRYCRTELDP
jgi:hypothetical protein